MCAGVAVPARYKERDMRELTANCMSGLYGPEALADSSIKTVDLPLMAILTAKVTSDAQVALGSGIEKV